MHVSEKLLQRTRERKPDDYASLFKRELDAHYPPGRQLGAGGYHKVAYEVVGKPHRVVLVLREESKRPGLGGPWAPNRVNKLVEEFEELNQLKTEWNVPVAVVRKFGSIDGRPAFVMDRYLACSKDKDLRERSLELPIFTEQALEDLATIRRAVDKGLIIRDFQALIGLNDRQHSSTGAPEIAVHDLAGIFDRRTLDDPRAPSHLKYALERRMTKQEDRLRRLTEIANRAIESNTYRRSREDSSFSPAKRPSGPALS